MEALYVCPLEQHGVMMEEEEQEKHGEQEEGGMEASSPVCSITDEETDEDSEPEPPPVVRRKVSFADAFGLDLVSVKEFDKAEVTESEVSRCNEREMTHSLEEFYVSCLFTVPSSSEELDQRLQAQMVELESIELLPGTAILRGTIRVVNLCYSKCVYARISLDRWNSYFDLLAEYLPGSSDRKTDRFTFKYTLVPPFEREGTRMDFCLRYETSVGTFWANNKKMNYVLFCHQNGHVKKLGSQMQEESSSYKSKRSCLKAKRIGSTEGNTWETINTATVAAEVETTHRAEKAVRKTKNSTEMQSLRHCEEHKSLVEGMKNRHAATRLACVHHYLSKRREQIPRAFPHDSAKGQKVSQPVPALWGDSADFPYKCQKTQPKESPQVLTYHQIPLLTLDWNSDKQQQWGAADVDDIWTGGAKTTLSKASEENTPSVKDMWETFLNGIDVTNNKETSVCDVWQAFPNGPSCKDRSSVPESEWLQTAASVSPSNNKGPQNQCAASSQEFREFQVGKDTPTTLHAHTYAACQLLSDSCESLLANVALNTENHQPAEACVSSPRDDNTGTRDTTQRSQTNSVTDTPQEFSLKGATSVSKDSIDSSGECHMLAVLEREREGIIGGAEEVGGDELFTWHTADLVTSSGESETTDMTAMPESQNANAVDRISQGARQDEGLSSGGEGEVIGTIHNAMDDKLAFRKTIRQWTKDGARCVFSTSRQGAEEKITLSCTENKEIFKPHKTKECEISPRYAEELQREKFRLPLNSENQLVETERDENEIRPTQSHEDGFDPKQMCEQNKIMETALAKDVQSNNKDISNEAKGLISTGMEMIQVLGEHARQHQDNASSCKTGNTSIILEANDKQTWPIQVGEEVYTQKREHEHVLNQTMEGKSLMCDGIIKGQEELNPSAQTRLTVETEERKMAFQSDRDTFRACPTEKCKPNPVEVGRWTHSQQDMKGQKEDVGIEISPEEFTARENVAKKDTSTETSERIDKDMSQEDKDERVNIGKLKIEAIRELIGNVESPREDRKSAPAEEKEQELSAKVESSPCVEYKKLSDGTKDPITAEKTASIEQIESGLEEAFVERFGENLVSGVWEEVFGWEVQDSNIVDGIGCGLRDSTQDCHLLFDLNDAFDSGVFSLTELPADRHSSFCQGPEETIVTAGRESSPKERSQSLGTTERLHFHPELQTDLNSSAYLSQDLTVTLAAHSRQSVTDSALSSPKDQENYSLIKERSITRQETERKIEDCVVTRKESFNRSAHPSHKTASFSAEKLKKSDGLAWFSILSILSHITRLLICTILVGGFFVIVFLYDFPAFFALYIFSLCWWFCKWKRHRVAANKGTMG